MSLLKYREINVYKRKCPNCCGHTSCGYKVNVTVTSIRPCKFFALAKYDNINYIILACMTTTTTTTTTTNTTTTTTTTTTSYNTINNGKL